MILNTKPIALLNIIPMKTNIHVCLVAFFISSALLLYSQETCKVLKPGITDTYEGKCKNGLAHGKGIATGTDHYEGQFVKGQPHGTGKYTWANGDTYNGEWAYGERNGVGKYIMKLNGRDSIQDGVWQDDDYKGPKPKSPNVTYKSGVDRYTFQKNNTTKNRVLIDFTQNGIRNKRMTNLLMSTTSGSETKVGESIGYDFVTFPVSIKIKYTSPNKLQTISYTVEFEFEIFEPGDWKVELEN